jgi:membrane protein DedA with SNARE-associated domain
MNSVLELLGQYRYVAMFTILVLCGMGLPLPEEVTLLASGLAVGWRQADFLLASLACVGGILVGDAAIFAMGRYFGRRFLRMGPMRWLLPPRRQARVKRLFARHGNKTVFFARFFVGIRIGIYAYAGQHGMKWSRFLFLDLLGALISGPTSIWVGKFAAEKIADPEEAHDFAVHILHRAQHWIYIGIGVLVVLGVLHWFLSHRGERRKPEPEVPPGATPPPPGPRDSAGVEGDSPRSP